MRILINLLFDLVEFGADGGKHVLIKILIAPQTSEAIRQRRVFQQTLIVIGLPARRAVVNFEFALLICVI